MAVKKYNRIWNSNLSDIAGELQALQMEHDTDLNSYVKGNIDLMNDKGVIPQDYQDLMEEASERST